MQLILMSHTCTSRILAASLNSPTYRYVHATKGKLLLTSSPAASSSPCECLSSNDTTLKVYCRMRMHASREHLYIRTNVCRRELLEFSLYGTFLALQGPLHQQTYHVRLARSATMISACTALPAHMGYRSCYGYRATGRERKP